MPNTSKYINSSEMPVFFFHHFNDELTIVYKDHVQNGSRFCHASQLQTMFDESDIAHEQQDELLKEQKDEVFWALNNKILTESQELTSIDDLLNSDNRYRFPTLFSEIIRFSGNLYAATKQREPIAPKLISTLKSARLAAELFYFISINMEGDDISAMIQQDYADMRQIILDIGNSKYAYEYCRHVSDDADMREIMFNDSDLLYLICYVTSVNASYATSPRLKKLISENKNAAEWAFIYCCEISHDAEMRQIVINANNPEWALEYCKEVSNDDDMRQVILDSRSPEWASKYCRDVSRDADMLQIIEESKNNKPQIKTINIHFNPI